MRRAVSITGILFFISAAQVSAQRTVSWKVSGDTTGAPAGCSAAAAVAAIDTWFAAFHDVDSVRLDRATAFRFVFSNGKFTPLDTFRRVESMAALVRYARARTRRHERMTLEAVRFSPWRGARLGFLPYFVRSADDLGRKPLLGIGKAEYWCQHGIRVLNLAPRPANDPGSNERVLGLLGGVPTGRERFDLRNPAQRNSFRALLKNERALWRASMPRDYRFDLRVSCFCPGQRSWLSMDVSNGRLVGASDSTGAAMTLTDWNTLTIDGVFDSLERSVDLNALIEVTFDVRWHFPTYSHLTVLPGPDAWSTTETRDFRPR